MPFVYALIPLLPLLAAAIVGLFGRRLSRRVAHSLTILGVALAFLLSIWVWIDVAHDQHLFYGNLYTWLSSGDYRFSIGFMIDNLSATMMVVVTFISLMVHIYTIGYMQDDPGYNRFFSYISLFTFSMLMLVMSNNFLQLFFGWEAVGLVSYLLIGFWYQKPTAIYANLKAFLVNRVGDFGFLLGIAMVLFYLGTLDYQTAFERLPEIAQQTVSLVSGQSWSLVTVICLLLFVGAMGKSAQVPLHVWLPDSMEGPTPISALIHAATMVTAGIFMVARMSPFYELSDTALSVVLCIGSITALSMAFLGVIQNDIKRVVAYSTLSQLGYMTVALGVSAYSVAMFHLVTHAFFKALLFLAAGSVIIALHHEQDLRKMGGLWRYLPITFITSVIGSLALAGIPPFAGFFSKDLIIEAVSGSHIAGARFAYFSVVTGVFLTAFYSFRQLFLAFSGQYRGGHGSHETHHHEADHGHHEPHESPKVVTLPLILLAIPSVLAGMLLIRPIMTGDFFGASIYVAPRHDVLDHIALHFHGIWGFIEHGVRGLPFILAIAGIVTAWLCYVVFPSVPGWVVQKLHVLVWVLERKYGFDWFNEWFFARGSRTIGQWLWRWGDVKVIDGCVVNGSAQVVARCSGWLRHVQSGLIYHYAFAMLVGVFALLTIFLPIV